MLFLAENVRNVLQKLLLLPRDLVRMNLVALEKLNYYRLKPVDLTSAGSRLKIILGFEVTIGRF
jgi:hypothetical protein